MEGQSSPRIVISYMKQGQVEFKGSTESQETSTKSLKFGAARPTFQIKSVDETKTETVRISGQATSSTKTTTKDSVNTLSALFPQKREAPCFFNNLTDPHTNFTERFTFEALERRCEQLFSTQPQVKFVKPDRNDNALAKTFVTVPSIPRIVDLRCLSEVDC